MPARSEALRRCPLPIADLEPSARDFESAVVLPGACYSDPGFFEFEMQALYAREWICVGRADLVPDPGDYYTITVIGEPLIVVRNHAGAIRVLSAVCRHRGMVITAPAQARPEHWLDAPRETSGNLRAFRCPYHWWSYDLDGQLVGAPQMERTPGFDRGACALPGLRVETWNGFVFVNFDAGAAPLAPRLAAIERFVANWHLEALVSVHPETIPNLPFNWKIMVENFMEGYHPDRLHHGIHDWAPSSAMEYAPYQDGDAAIYGWTRSTHPDGGFNASKKCLFPPIETLTQAQRWLVPFIYVPPSLLIGMQSDSAFWFTVLPTSATTHSLSMSYVFPRSTTRLPMFQPLFEAAVAGVGLFNNQDLPTNTAVQVGMRSRYAPRGRYSWQEAVCAHFNRWLVARYRAHDVRARG
jgi:phenylpropionate dioxygenase-like ring-hydroxylating dioxygenase large terminal subunit